MSALFWLSYVLLWLLAIVLVVLVLLMYRQFGLIAMSGKRRIGMSGLDLGTVPPDTPVAALDGQALTVLEWRSLGSSVVVFGMAGCSSCAGLRLDPGIAELPHRFPDTRFLWIEGSSDPRDDLPPGWDSFSSERGQAHELLDVYVSPFAYAIDPAGQVHHKGVVNNANEIASMLTVPVDLDEDRHHHPVHDDVDEPTAGSPS